MTQSISSNLDGKTSGSTEGSSAPPVTSKGMSVEWFRSVLGGHGGEHISSIELEPVGGGLLARMVRAKLTYEVDSDGPSSVIVKFPTDDAGSLGLALAMGMYELETRFYQDVAPLLQDMALPTCYHAAVGADSTTFTLVLEDLSECTRPGDVLQASSLDDCANVLGELVKFQAPLWNSPVLQNLDWLSDPTRTHQIFDSMTAGMEPFLERFGHGLDAAHVKMFERVLPQAGNWVRQWKAPTVVQHGDFRTDNIMFGLGPDAPAVTVIDFQTIRQGPPGIDPAYFLGSSLSTETRRACERDLITEYHRQLVAAGVPDFDFDACWSAYREGALYGVFLFVGAASQVESTERGDRLITDQIKRYADMAVDLESAAAANLT